MVLYHAGISWLPAGFLGVDTFFVLSGFLITTLLLNELRHSKTIRLGAFWARRARRLVPAMLLVVSFCALFVWIATPVGTYSGFRLDALSTLLYVANWHFILEGANYFAATSAPSPLTHTWSLAIEEQFYVLWPLVLFGLFKLGRGARTLAIICGGGAVLSAIEMAWLLASGSSITRLYYGTDTHAQCLFVGAGLASVLAVIAQGRRIRGAIPSGRAMVGRGGDPGWAATSVSMKRLMEAAGLIGLFGGALLWTLTSWSGTFLYNGGFLLMALCAGLVILSVVSHQQGLTAIALSVSPMVFLGRISYGLYLWHYPLFQWLDGTRTGLSGPALLAVRLGATFVVSVASFYLIERPIRHGASLRGWSGAVATICSLLVTLGLVIGATIATNSTAGGIASIKRFSTSSAHLVNPVRVLLAGDSTALTLGFPLSYVGFTTKYDAVLSDQGVEGCGVITSDANYDKGVLFPAAPECATTPPAGTISVSDKLRNEVRDFRPDTVAILVGRWEVHDQVRNGHTVTIEDPAFQADVRRGLDDQIAIATSHGARVVLYTQMCSASGSQPDGQPWPEDSPQRLAIYNGIVRDVAKAHRGTVTLVDLNKMVCPKGQFMAALHGHPIRQADGVHVDINARRFYGPRLWPMLIEVGKRARSERHAKAASRPAPRGSGAQVGST